MKKYLPMRATRTAIASRTEARGAERGPVRPSPVQPNRPPAATHQTQTPVHQFANLPLDRTADAAPPPNRTGLPDRLKAGVEHLSGLAMDDVRVHYHSSMPATVQALAYTQGSNIHVAPGQEKHLPHEAWHAVQQKQGRVKPTLQMKGVAINDDAALEREAEKVGRQAVAMRSTPTASRTTASPSGLSPVRPPGGATGAPIQLFYERAGSQIRWVEDPVDLKYYEDTKKTIRVRQQDHPVYIKKPQGAAASPGTFLPKLPAFQPTIPPKGKSAKPAAAPGVKKSSAMVLSGPPSPPPSFMVTGTRMTIGHRASPQRVHQPSAPLPPVHGNEGTTGKPKLQNKATVIGSAGSSLASITNKISLNASMSAAGNASIDLKAPQTHDLTLPQIVTPSPKAGSSSPSNKSVPPKLPISPIVNLGGSTATGLVDTDVKTPLPAGSGNEDANPLGAMDFGDDVEPVDEKQQQKLDARANRNSEWQQKKSRLAGQGKQPKSREAQHKPGTASWMPIVHETSIYPRLNTSNNAVNLARHHIFPKSKLAEFYNTAAARGHLKVLDPLMQQAINQHDARRKHFQSNSEAKSVTKDELLTEWTHLRDNKGAGPKNAVAAQVLAEMYQWLPGNLFVGPDNRADDAKHGFEKDAGLIIGDQNVGYHKAAYEAAQVYLGAGGGKKEAGTSGQEKDATTVVSALLAASNRRTEDAYPFDEQKWDLNARKIKKETPPN